MSILDIPFLNRIRRHHALEHATIRILNRRRPAVQLAGMSAPKGFFVYGGVSTPEIESALVEAQARLSSGDQSLALHPHCGTNLVTAGTLTGLLAFLIMLPGDEHARRTRLPLVLLLSTLAMLLAQPLGLVVQQHVTTEANLGNLRVIRVSTSRIGQTPVHYVQLQDRSST